MRIGTIIGAIVLFATTATAEKVVFDFEDGTLMGWEVLEGDLDVRGDLISDRSYFISRPNEPYNKQGEYFLTTLESNGQSTDSMTGILESPVFIVTGPEATLLVGGGAHPETYVALCTLDNEEVRVARGINDETMQQVTWDTEPWIGEPMVLRVVDQHTGGWGHITLDDFRVAGRIDRAATEARREDQRRERRRAAVADLEGDMDALDTALVDLVARFGPDYPDGAAYQAQLDEIRSQAAQLQAATDITQTDWDSLAEAFEELQRTALIANPLVSGQPLLFITRPRYHYDHHNTETIHQRGEINEHLFRGGAALKTIDFGQGGAVETLLTAPEGIIRDPDISFDGSKVLFSMRPNRDSDYHIYEMTLNGRRLRRLTTAPYVSDIDPIYLPGGQILFSSTREPKYCMCNRHIMANLFTMDGDGANIQQIGHSTLFENHPALLPDGRVLYTRWEYVDRNFGDAQGLWTTNPDGTNHAVYYGNNTNSPGAVLAAQPLPGTHKALAILTSCHDLPWGALAIIDRQQGIDGRDGILRTWPPEAIDLVGVGDFDTFLSVSPKYEDPMPLSDTYFLASRQIDETLEMGLYLIDIFGNEVLLHSEAPGCYDVMPIQPRPEPPVIPSRVDLDQTEGMFYVENVYEGTGMDRVAPGEVTHLRVVESPEKRFWTQPAWDGGTGQQAPGMAWDDFNNKRILGTVPVEADGSAYFRVPADTFVYFQLLDAEGRMIQSMRSGTIVRPGETQGCVGCHDDRLAGPEVVAPMPAALQGPAQPLTDWFGPPRLFSYREEVQPVFDQNCISCHDYVQPAGERLNLAGDLGVLFNTSYVELRGKGDVRVIGAGPHEVQPPKSWGSHVSRLAEVVLSGHGDEEVDRQITLTPEERTRIITWIDINAPYYPDYASAYPDHLYGRSPLNPEQLARLSELTGIDLTHPQHLNAISFTRPEHSPCLEGLDAGSEAYAEAVELIYAGQRTLEARPRPDMPEFQLVRPEEIAQQAHYEMLQRHGAAFREALRQGQRRYDWSILTE